MLCCSKSWRFLMEDVTKHTELKVQDCSKESKNCYNLENCGSSRVMVLLACIYLQNNGSC